jgi:hypothetical protein
MSVKSNFKTKIYSLSNMKKTITIFFLTLFFSSLNAQDLPINEATEKVTFMEVVDATGLNSKEVYKELKNWAKAHDFKLKEEKSEEGELEYSATLSVPYERVKGKPEPSTISFNVFLFAKENKYRFILTDFVHEGTNATISGGKLENINPECGPSVNNVNWKFIKTKTKSGVEELLEDLRKKMKAAQNDPARKKDW